MSLRFRNIIGEARSAVFLFVLSCFFGASFFWGGKTACAEVVKTDGLAQGAVDALYAELGGGPIWGEPGKGLTARGAALIEALTSADREGLRPSDYLLEIEPNASKQPPKEQPQGKRQYDDRHLTEGMLRYISDVRDGRQSARNADPELVAIPRLTDAVTVLKAGLQAKDFATWLSTLPPQSRAYQNLRSNLERYRKLGEQDWPRLVGGPKLELGLVDENVGPIRARLKLLGDLPANTEAEGVVFDEALQAGVVRFQTRHGLATDGVVGAKTYAALNVSPTTRVPQIIVNMERLRWLPENLGARYVMVDIAGFELTAVSGDIEVLRTPVIVGRDQRRTPVINDKITNIIFRPTWTVPVKIARQDLLPKIQADVNYLNERGLRIFSSWQDGAKEVAPDSVDWKALTPKQLSFKFRQDAGPKNALGLIRFTLTNPYDIYLHDTPERSLFAKPGRAFSSGCIRVSDVVALAHFVMESIGTWGADSIQEAMNGNATKVVKLPVPLPIYIVYSTVSAEDAGTLHFREDIYDRDGALIRALALTGVR